MSASLLNVVARVGFTSLPDFDLLSRFRENRDQQAFEELIRRHGPLVWSVCRHLLPQHVDAEDAFQAVFLALAQGVDPERVGQKLPAWLHGVSVRVAAKVKRTAARRQRREQRAAIPEADRTVPDSSWSALMTAVHEEVQHLPSSEKTAFILCDLEGVPQPDAATRLGWPLGTLSGRLCKARQRLLDQLARRGLAPAVVAMGGSLAAVSGSVPALLLQKISSFSAAKVEVSSTVATLARGLAEGMSMRTKFMATMMFLVALGIGGGVWIIATAEAQLPKSGTPTKEEKEGRVGSLRVDMTSPAWEYKFVNRKTSDRDEFEKTVIQLGVEGWEYVGSEQLQKGETAQSVLVFKKSKNRSVGGAGQAAAQEAGDTAQKSELKIFALKHLDADYAHELLSKVFPSSPRGNVEINPESRTQSLIIRANDETIAAITKLLQTLDVPAKEPKGGV